MRLLWYGDQTELVQSKLWLCNTAVARWLLAQLSPDGHGNPHEYVVVADLIQKHTYAEYFKPTPTQMYIHILRFNMNTIAGIKQLHIACTFKVLSSKGYSLNVTTKV